MEQDISFGTAESQWTQIFIDDLPGGADHIMGMQPDVFDFWHKYLPSGSNRQDRKHQLLDSSIQHKREVVITLTN